MEKRDPLKDVANTSSSNESQESVDDVPKPPEPGTVPNTSSDNKENGFSRKVQKTDSDKSDIGCGSSKPKEIKPRRSILEAFDPLFSASSEKFEAASLPVLEDLDEPESTQAVVSKDDTPSVDACTAPDEASSDQFIKDPQIEESLLIFKSPEKVHVTGENSDSESTSTSEEAEFLSVLSNIEASTSSSGQSPTQNQAVCSTSFSSERTESEILRAISGQSGSDSDIPPRSRFTLTKNKIEPYNIHGRRFDRGRNRSSSPPQENVAGGITTNSLTSVDEIRNVSPERSNVLLEATRSDESSLTDEVQISEHTNSEVTVTVAKAESSDDSRESENTVINKTSEIHSEGKEESTSTESTSTDSTEEKTEYHIAPEPDSQLPSEPGSSETPSSGEENEPKDTEKDIGKDKSSKEIDESEDKKPPEPEENFESQPEEKLGDEHKSEQESEDKQAEKQEASEDEQKSNFEEDKKELANEPQPKPSSEEEHSQEAFEKLDKQLGSDCKTEPEAENPQEPPQSEKSQDSKFTDKAEEPQANLDPNSEDNSQPQQEPNYQVGSEKSEVDQGKCDSSELGGSNKEAAEATSASSEIVPLGSSEQTTSSEQATPEEKTEEEVQEAETQETDTKSEATGESDAYIQPDEEHHVDSGLDSIEESYTKSPKSQEVDSEDSERSEDLDPSKKEDRLPDEKFNSTNDEPKLEITLDEGPKILADVPVQDEEPQLLVEPAKPKIEETDLIEGPIEPESERTLNLTDNQKSVIKTSTEVESYKAKMADFSEKLNEQQQEISDLKLQLNAIQQAKASLELEIRQKEEVIIKAQAEALKNEQAYKQEIKQLREKLKENSKLIEKDSCKELEDQLKEAKAKEAKAVAELNQRTKDDLNYQKIMEEYENTIATRFADYQKLKEEHETATRHLANIELAFSDVHQKYERTKTLLEGFKLNEEALNDALQSFEKTCKQHEERYESLKAHAKGQIEKSNKEILMLRDKYEMDINKLKAIIKRLEIKCSSLEVSLQQKTEECAALSALCDEVTGKRV